MYKIPTTEHSGHREMSSSLASCISVRRIFCRNAKEVDCLFKYKLAISIGKNKKLKIPCTIKYVLALRNSAGKRSNIKTIQRYAIFLIIEYIIIEKMV